MLGWPSVNLESTWRAAAFSRAKVSLTRANFSGRLTSLHCGSGGGAAEMSNRLGRTCHQACLSLLGDRDMTSLRVRIASQSRCMRTITPCLATAEIAVSRKAGILCPPEPAASYSALQAMCNRHDEYYAACQQKPPPLIRSHARAANERCEMPYGKWVSGFEGYR